MATRIDRFQTRELQAPIVHRANFMSAGTWTRGLTGTTCDR